MKAAALRRAHASAKPLVTALAHDALSARLIEAAGFPAFNIGGSSLLASRYALPDLGIAALGEMADAMREIVAATQIPCLVDADDGYGGPRNVARTIEVFENLGVGGVLLEDQDRAGKRPGDAAAKDVVPIEVMRAKLATARAARSDDLVVIGRTDALGAVGMEEALRRAEAYLQAGADGVFVAGLRTPEQFERVGNAVRGAWNVAAVFEDDGDPPPTPGELHALGFSQVVYPAAVVLRVVRAIEDTLERIRVLAAGERRVLADSPGELSLAGFQRAVQLEAWRMQGEDEH